MRRRRLSRAAASIETRRAHPFVPADARIDPAVAQVLSFALMEQVTVQRLSARSEKVAPRRSVVARVAAAVGSFGRPQSIVDLFITAHLSRDIAGRPVRLPDQPPPVRRRHVARVPGAPPRSGAGYLYTYIYIYTHTHTHTLIYIYIHVYVHGPARGWHDGVPRPPAPFPPRRRRRRGNGGV